MSSITRWINDKAQSSLNPSQVEHALSSIAEQWSGDDLPEFFAEFPLGADALIHLLAVSTICAERLQRNPEILQWLARPEISASNRGPRRMLAELHSGVTSVTAENFRHLRLWKGREMTRIALREVAGVCALEETTTELSYLAEVCLSTVYHEADERMRALYGAPQTQFTALGLGKLGGYELNHSSDVDLIFLYGDEGELSPRLTIHEWHNRLAEDILRPFGTGEPPLLRVDLRLRPEGSAGPLTRSLESMENYYSGFGETWERFALMKARRVFGSEELAYEFLRQHQPFIFPKSPTPELLDDIAAMKRRIEREVPADELNVKLGAGGIREIEFIVQTIQFMHGAHHAFLQEPGTMKGLHAIAQLELLPLTEIRQLDRAYRFLRKVEHRVQIEAELQTHSVPDDPLKRECLARSLDFASADDLTRELQSCMTAVREIFHRLIASGEAGTAPDLRVFADQNRADRNLVELAQGSSRFHVAPRTRQLFRKLKPLLVSELASCADPDATLTAIVRFVEAFGLRSLLFELLATNPKLLELLVRTFDSSSFAASLLVRRPQLLEEITRSGDFGKSRTVSDHLQRLQSAVAVRDLDKLRVYRQTQLLRTIIRDVIGLLPLHSLFEEISALGEACLLAAAQCAQAGEITLIAMGKFGGRELTYGSDFDLMFVGEDHRAAQNLLGIATAPTSEGAIASIDVRLRPEGEKGPLVGSFEAFEAYYRDRAQLWEIQALTRARPFAGPHQNEFREIAHAAWSVAGRDPDLFDKVNAMLERVRKERGGGKDALEFKTGVGGIVEAEFLVQGLQMRHDIRETSTVRAIQKLSAVFSRRAAEFLSTAYDFLRRIETVLRRQENTGVSILPPDPEEQRRLGRRLGFENRETFQLAYDKARTDIHNIYLKHFHG